MVSSPGRYDIVMLGTFAAWRLGTLQSRALPLASVLTRHGIRCAIVTTPWDVPSERGIVDVYDGVPIFNTYAVSPFAPLQAVREQRDLARLLQPQAIHVFKPKGFGGLTGAWVHHDVPLIVDSDDWEGDGGWNQVGSYGLLQRRVFDWQERTLLRSADGVTAASTLLFQRASMMRGSESDSSVWLVPNGIERTWYERLKHGRVPVSITDRIKTVVLYSRFAEFGAEWLPRFASALDRVANCPVRIVAVGTDGDDWVVGEHVRVELCGYVERDRLPEMLGSASIAIFPYESSLLTMAKQSVKLLELMAARCAIVASDVGDVAGVLGGTGVTLPGADPLAFAAVVGRLFQLEAYATSLGMAAQQRVREHFLIESSISTRLIAAYRGVGVQGVG